MSYMVKLPSKIRIAGAEYTVRQNKDTINSEFDTGEHSIVVGVKNSQPIEILDRFFHEVLECMATVYGLRYLDGSMQRVMIVMEHEQFSHLITNFAEAIKDITIKRS